jgi:hypothetical protein
MRAILENGTSPIKKSSVPGEAFPSRILYAHQFQSNYLPRQKTGTKNSSTSLTTKYQRSLKKAGLECIFLTHNANLHKINLEKLLKQRNTLDTREPRTESVSMESNLYNGNNKPALIRALQSR